MPNSYSRRTSLPGEQLWSHRDSRWSSKATPSSSVSSFSHSRALACPTADPERVILLQGFYWRSSAADVRQICEQDFGPVRVVLLYQGKLYPEAFVDFVHRRDAAQCVLKWARPTKIYRARDKFDYGSRFIKWAFGVTACSYKPSMNNEDWARAWKDRDRIERGEQPGDVLAPRWKQTSVREEEERRMQKRYSQSSSPSASKSKERQRQIFRDSGSAGNQDSHSYPLLLDAGVVGDTPVDIDTVLAGTTLVGSPASYSKDSVTTVNVDNFLEKIVEDSDLTALSIATTTLQLAVQNFMDTVDEFNTLTYERSAETEAESFVVPYFGFVSAGETSIESAAGEENFIGLVESLFRIQRMVELDLRV